MILCYLFFFHIHLGIGNVSTIVSTNQPWQFYIKRASIFHSFSKYKKKKKIVIFLIVNFSCFPFEIEIGKRHIGIQMYTGRERYIYIQMYI